MSGSARTVASPVADAAPAPATSPMAVADLVRYLDQAEPFTESFNVRLDEAEEFPEEACRLLDRAGVHHYYVPRAFGGALEDHTDLVRVVRAIARKDLTVAIAHVKTFLGGACTWVAAEEPSDGRMASRAQGQALRLGARVIEGTVVSWGLTEPDRGSDLRAGRLTAERVSAGYRLDGRKWPVNNATRGDMVCVLTRTGQGSGARDFTLLLVDKGALSPGSHTHLSKVRTVGIRGADISGIVFDGAVVSEEAAVGPVGSGFELVLKAFQLTRTVCAGLSLGAADHALDVVWDFVRERQLYNRPLVELPHVRTRLGSLFAARHTAEAVSLVAARAVRALPGEMSVYSAVVKALVPETVDDLVGECAELLGARAFLRGELRGGTFQKLERDHRIVGIFDGNSFVNRQSLIRQFPRLAACWERGGLSADGVLAATDTRVPLPPGGGLRLVSRTGCSLLQALPDAVRRLRSTGVDEAAVRSAERVLNLCDRLHHRMAASDTGSRSPGAELFEDARSYELCVAASAVVHTFLARSGRPRPDAVFDELCLRASLVWILSLLGERRDEGEDGVYAAVADAVEVRLGREPRLPSLLDDEDGDRR